MMSILRQNDAKFSYYHTNISLIILLMILASSIHPTIALTETVLIPPEFLAASLKSPCDIYTISCISTCKDFNVLPSTNKCILNQNALTAAVECVCTSGEVKTLTAAQVFTLSTVLVPIPKQRGFCNDFRASCEQRGNATQVPIGVNACRPSTPDTGVPNEYYATCITVSSSLIFREERNIEDRLIPLRPQIAAVSRQYAEKACQGFTAICARTIAGNPPPESATSSCIRYRPDQLQVQCTKAPNENYTEQTIQAITPVQYTITQQCLGKNLCGEYSANCSKLCMNNGVALNTCYAPYLVNRYAFGCICWDGRVNNIAAFAPIANQCGITLDYQRA
ncbi:hypothetical protein G9A89_005556 [Geosiphon pyriformis]|nr:hypothetical protein G9A89_005556 [Geosiphon pyriformis]